MQFKPGQLSAPEAAELNRMRAKLKLLEEIKVAAPLRLNRTPSGWCIEAADAPIIEVGTSSGGFYPWEDGVAFPTPIGGVPNISIFPAGLYVYPGEKICVNATAVAVIDATLGINTFYAQPYYYNFDTGTFSPFGSNQAIQTSYSGYSAGGVNSFIGPTPTYFQTHTTVVFQFDNTNGTAQYAIGFKYGFNANGGALVENPFGVYTATTTQG